MQGLEVGWVIQKDREDLACDSDKQFPGTEYGNSGVFPLVLAFKGVNTEHSTISFLVKVYTDSFQWWSGGNSMVFDDAHTYYVTVGWIGFGETGPYHVIVTEDRKPFGFMDSDGHVTPFPFKRLQAYITPESAVGTNPILTCNVTLSVKVKPEAMV